MVGMMLNHTWGKGKIEAFSPFDRQGALVQGASDRKWLRDAKGVLTGAARNIPVSVRVPWHSSKPISTITKCWYCGRLKQPTNVWHTGATARLRTQ